MKTVRILLSLLLVLAFNGLSGCESETSMQAWESVQGQYVWEESAQFSNATLVLKWMNNAQALFEFRLMEGSEAEDSAIELCIPGVLSVGEDGIGHYEARGTDGTVSLAIRFVLSTDAQTVEISHEGELPISPDGRYTFTDSGMEVSEALAKELLRFLPTNATSLEETGTAYTLHYPDGLVCNWFYPVEATLSDTGALLARFVVAKDLSAVFRVDDGITPMLIYGTAHPMMEAEFYPEDIYLDSLYEDTQTNTGAPPAEDILDWDSDILDDPLPIVSIGLKDGAFMSIGDTNAFAIQMPWELPYTWEAVSADPSILRISDNTLTATGAGETQITGTITIADASKDFAITVTVFDHGQEGRGDTIPMEYIMPTTEAVG